MVNIKRYLSSLWTDRMTVTEQKKVNKPNQSTKFAEVVVLEDVPCKLSFSTLRAANQNDTVATAGQVAKLFLDRSINIKPGSKITVMRGDQVFEFSQSGLAGMFSCHQEIVLAPFERYT